MARSIELARVFFSIEAETKGLDNQLKGAEKSLGRLGNFIKANPAAAAGALGVALLGIAAKAAEMAEKVQHSMRLVSASMKVTSADLKALTGDLAKLSIQTGRTQVDLAEMARLVAGNGVASIEELRAVLAAGTLAADATGGDLAQILTGLDGVLDSFSIKGDRAEQVLAKLFVTAQGKTTLPALLEAFERLSPVVQRLGVDFETTAAAVTTLINRGRTTKQVVAELGTLDLAGFQALARESYNASSGIKELRDQAALMRDALDNDGAKIAARWDAAMLVVGNATSGATRKLKELLLNYLEIAKAAPVVRESAAGINGVRPFLPGVDTPGGLTDEQRKAMNALERQMADMLVGFTQSAVDNTMLALKRFQEEARKVMADLPAAEAEAMQRQVDAVIAGFRRQIEEIRQAALVARQTPLTPKVVAGDQIPLRTDFSAADKQMAERTKEMAEAEQELADKRREAIQSAAAQAQAIEQAGRGALQLAEAMGILSDEAAAAAQAVLQIASATDQLSALSKLDTKASFSEMLGPILGIAGGLASLVSSLFGESPEEKRKREVQQENTEAIRDLSKSIGVFGGQLSGTAGSTTVGVREATAAALAGGPHLGDPVSGRLRRELADLGLSMTDLREVAQSLGISFANANPSVAELQQLLAAITASQLAARSGTFAGQLGQLQDIFDVFDISDPLEQLRRLMDLFDDPKFGSPALRQALAGLDLSTPEGRAAAEKAIQELVKRLGLSPDQGGISLGDLGGMSPEEFRQALLDLEKRLDELGQSSGPQGETQGFAVSRTITEAQGSLVISQLTTVAYWQERLYHLLDMRMLQPPSIIPGVPQGAAYMDVTINVSLPPGADVASATVIGGAAGKAAAAEFNSLLGASLRTRKLLSGNVTTV